MKKAIVLIIFLLFTNKVYADKKFEKDLKILSKFNSFINNKGESYPSDLKFNKDETIILIYAHGQLTDRREKCNKWNKVPPAIYQLDGITINDFTVRVYHLCYGIGRSWTQKEQDYFWNIYEKNNQDPKSILNLKNKKGEILLNKNEIWRRTKAMKLKVDEFVDKGFNNIVLSGISAGACTSLVLKSDFPDLIDGVVGFAPARSGKYAKKNLHKAWVNWRNYKMSLIKVDKLDKVLVYAHEKDDFENTKTLSFLSNSKTVKFIDLSDTKCKGKIMLGSYHGITLTKCFANKDPRSKEIKKYLEEIY